MRIDELDTPVLVCDLDVLERNIHATADLCRTLDIPLRVHSKSHKIPEIAHKQMAAGAVGVWTKADSVTYFDDLTVVTQ